MAVQSVHPLDNRYQNLLGRIRRSALSEDDKQLLFDFDHYCVAENLSFVRRTKLLNEVFTFCVRFLNAPMRSATVQQIFAAVQHVEASNYAAWTKNDFKIAIRKAFKFIAWGNEALVRKDYPPTVSGIRIGVRKRDRVTVQAADILTEQEMETLLNAAVDTQDRALFAVMYELGARVGEVGTMSVSSVTRDAVGFLCDLNGKTGYRTVRIIGYAGSLATWLNCHPRRDDPSAPLWGYLQGGKWHAMQYANIAKHLRRLVKAAGIKKRVHPHLFRHSRITHVQARGQLNDAQVKNFFGLVPDSDMLGVYTHILNSDANNAVMRMYNIAPVAQAPMSQPQRCGACSEINDSQAHFCVRCRQPLSVAPAAALAERTQGAISQFMPLLDTAEGDALLRRLIREELERLARDRPLSALV